MTIKEIGQKIVYKFNLFSHIRTHPFAKCHSTDFRAYLLCECVFVRLWLSMSVSLRILSLARSLLFWSLSPCVFFSFCLRSVLYACDSDWLYAFYGFVCRYWFSRFNEQAIEFWLSPFLTLSRFTSMIFCFIVFRWFRHCRCYHVMHKLCILFSNCFDFAKILQFHFDF